MANGPTRPECRTDPVSALVRAGAALYAQSKAADERASMPEARMAVQYLNAFGYLGRELEDWKDITLGDLVDALASFQEFFGLKQSGILDTAVVRSMEKYRCGCPDVVSPDTVAGAEFLRVRQFAATNLPRWQKTSIKYTVEAYVSGLSKTEQDEVFDKAFDAWERVCGITVERAGPGQTADVVIGTGQGQRSNFDGAGGTLAWAYLPQGDDRQLVMKFDMDESWVGTGGASARGILMFNVAAHEFGHLLGLDHSRVQTALMAPFYDPNTASPRDNDDIPRAQARYGPSVITPPTPPLPPVPPTPGAKRVIEVVGATQILVDGRPV